MFGSDRVTPEVLLGLGNLARGNNWGEQVANAGTGVLAATTAAKEKAVQEEARNKTAELLQVEAPDLAVAVRTGALTATDAYRQHLERKAKAEEAKRPDYSFMNVDGRIVRADKNSGNFEELADYSKPKLPAIADEYNWAKENGFKGTPQEYQAWKANLGKQKGMTVQYDPENGFRMTQGDVDTMPNLTVEQGKNAGFLKRALSAERELSALEDEGTSVWNKAASGLPLGAGNFLVSKDAQKFNQAKRNFINAVLRRESGAVISEAEFENANQQYFPQPGDAPEVIEQKRKNREDAIAGFKLGSGPAAQRVQDMDSAEQPATDLDSLVEKYRTK